MGTHVPLLRRGTIATVTYPNGVSMVLSYDQLNRVTGLATQSTGYAYQRDQAGKLISALELNNRQVTWNYDGINRLTSETITNAPSGKNGTVGYGLDPVGNRTSANSGISGLSPVSGSFNADDQLSSETYDQNGNVLTTGGKTFAYDAENHLVSMGSTVAVLYDGDGNRVAKSVSGTVTRYLVDDLNPTGYPQVVDELNGSGAVTRTYSYGLECISEYQPIGGTWSASFYGYDGGGNTRQLTSSTGSITDTYEYDAWGNLLNSTGTTPNAYMYRGEFFDSDLGLYYLRARWMNPLTGRFLSRDPEDGIPADPMTLQKYVYADSDPVNASDPSGRAALAEDVQVTVKIDLGALPAVAAAGCAVKLAYNVIALKVVNDFDITPTANCGAKGKGRMRIQLQAGTNVTVPGTPVLVRDDPPSVTKADAYAGLLQLWGIAQSPQSGFPFNANQSDLRSAIISISQCVKRQTGTAPGIYTVCQAYLTNSTAGWRIDLENLNGINLRQ
jgi:RHS repeat-associated protein